MRAAVAPTSGTDPAISSPLPLRRDCIPSLVDRVLHRTTGIKSNRQLYRRNNARALTSEKEPFPSGADEKRSDLSVSCVPRVAAPPPHQQPTSAAPDAGDITQRQPQRFCEKPTRAATLEMPSATPQPQLKKKASFRDRLRAWQKPPQSLEIVSEESKPRFVYEPKHAASDFSRLAVSPLSSPRQRPAPPTQILAECDRPPAPTRNHDESGRALRKDEESAPRRQHSRSGARRHSYALVEDPYQASNAAAHVPVNNRPVAWTPGMQSAAWKEEQVSQPLSDYELFIARAEAEDRERREQVLRSISQRSAVYSANRVKPDPHRQFVSMVSSSAEMTMQKRNSGRYVLGGDGAEQAQQQQQTVPRTGHARQSSWTPSYTTGGSGSRQQPSPAQLPPQEGQRRRRPPEPPSAQQPTVDGVDEESSRAREVQPQPPQALRRQASLTKRIVGYIRPPKAAVPPAKTLVE